MSNDNKRFLLLKAGSHSVKAVSVDNPGYESFNRAVGADWGAVVHCADLSSVMNRAGGFGAHKVVDLWIDDEGALSDKRVMNDIASLFAGQVIYGDALVMLSDPHSGESGGMPLPVLAWVATIVRNMVADTDGMDKRLAQLVEAREAWMEATGGTGIKITFIDEKGGAA
jgi:hypothetical protein